MKRIGLFLILILAIFVSFAYSPIIVSADSGWDTDYGGGSDWGGSSDWGSSDWGGSSSWDHDSSSSWDHSSSWSHDSGGSNFYSSRGRGSNAAYYDDDLFVYVIIIICVIVFVYLFTSILSISYKSRRKESNSLNKYIGDSDIEIQRYFPGFTEKQLISVLYQKFVDVQNAWMNFDYEALEKLCSDELYNSYKSDLEVLKASHGQNIMSDYQMEAANINGIKQEGSVVTIMMYLHASFYDYVINTNNNTIIKGTDKTKVHNQYGLEFIVTRGETVTKCPSCGAPLEKGEKECSYCHTLIINDYSYFVLNTKRRIS